MSNGLYKCDKCGEICEQSKWHFCPIDRTSLDELSRAKLALKDANIGGVFDEFRDLPDAIEQMALHISQLTIENARLTAALDRVRDDARLSRGLAARLLCELGYAPDPRAATQLASIEVITSRNTRPFKGKARPLTDDECDAILAAARTRPEGSNG